jgi:pimeloyl-ACP methyl ester carboxylesterase
MHFIVEGYPAFAYTGGKAYDPSLPAIVFVHGAAFDHSVWQWQSRFLAHHGYGVLALDLPAHGRSPGHARTSIEAMADWVAHFIEAAGHERAHVVGHSMGALVALDVALRHRARVDRLALLGIALPMQVNDAFLNAARDDSPAAFEMQTTWGHARQSLLSQSPVPGVSLAGASLRLNTRAAAGVQHADLNACNAYAPSIDAIRSLDTATLVIGGRRDQMTGPKAAEAFARGLPEAQVAMLDAGHSLMNEAPRETLAALKRFFDAGRTLAGGKAGHTA